MILEEFLITRRMDEIRLEKELNINDHPATTSKGALGGPESSTGNHPNAASPAHAPNNPTHATDTKKNKYGTFFKWSS
jgi:hypothetical protein